MTFDFIVGELGSILFVILEFDKVTVVFFKLFKAVSDEISFEGFGASQIVSVELNDVSL
jgi:hypothetical protein